MILSIIKARLPEDAGEVIDVVTYGPKAFFACANGVWMYDSKTMEMKKCEPGEMIHTEGNP